VPPTIAVRPPSGTDFARDAAAICAAAVAIAVTLLVVVLRKTAPRSEQRRPTAAEREAQREAEVQQGLSSLQRLEQSYAEVELHTSEVMMPAMSNLHDFGDELTVS
jgi:hypothetical protein